MHKQPPVFYLSSKDPSAIVHSFPACVSTRTVLLQKAPEINSVIRIVLSHTVPEDTETDGRKEKSRAGYIPDAPVKIEAINRAADLPGRFRLFPERRGTVLL